MRGFLAAIPFPQIVVPGNHDVPLYNLVSRFARKLDRYTRYVTDDLQPVFADSEIVVAGVNTARALTWKDGRINRRQLKQLRATLEPVPPERTKIVVTHHPFDLPAGASGPSGGAFAAGHEDAGRMPGRSSAGGPFSYRRHEPDRQALQDAGVLGHHRFLRHEHFHARPRPAEFAERDSNRPAESHDRTADLAASVRVVRRSFGRVVPARWRGLDARMKTLETARPRAVRGQWVARARACRCHGWTQSAGGTT